MIELCRDCDHVPEAGRPGAPGVRHRDGACPACGSRRLVAHDELFDLAIAHIDCDAFYASIEKRDDPSLRDKPVIVGGGRRGVVSAACYVARMYGIRSAMPMYKALAACPAAVVIRPDMEKYAEAGRTIRGLMQEMTPAVEPISIDEAFLDLSGTERLHHAPPAVTLNRLVRRIEATVGVTASIGLSHNKFLAKIASDLDKPRGFSVIGRAETVTFLAAQPVGLIWGVGHALQSRLASDGIETVGQLQALPEDMLVARYGSMGRRLARLSRGEDDRAVVDHRPAKSISSETTFDVDRSDFEELRQRLWPLCEKVSKRMKRAGVAGRVVTLKLKTKRFRLLTRQRGLPAPTQLAEEIYRAALPLLETEATGAAFRLIGVGLSDLSPATGDALDLLDPQSHRRATVERTIDELRGRLGDAAVLKGRAFGGPAGSRGGSEGTS